MGRQYTGIIVLTSFNLLPAVNYRDHIVNWFIPFLNLMDQSSYSYSSICQRIFRPICILKVFDIANYPILKIKTKTSKLRNSAQGWMLFALEFSFKITIFSCNNEVTILLQWYNSNKSLNHFHWILIYIFSNFVFHLEGV